MAGPLLFLLAASPADLQQILLRISEAAARLQSQAANLVAEETFRQRSLKPPTRYQTHQDSRTAEREYRLTEIVSQYSLAVFQGSLHEFRQVTSVDGRQVRNLPEARRALSLGIRSDSDRQRKRLLEDFQKYGLEGAATDFGPLLLLFTKAQAGHYRFAFAGSTLVGAERALIVSYEQVSGDEALLVFAGRDTVREPLRGYIFVRQPDNLPLRITMQASRKQAKKQWRDEASVDYIVGPQGCLVPAAVVHRSFADRLLLVEDVFRYGPFRMFDADSEIQFHPGREVQH